MRQNLVLQTMASGLSFPKARAPNLDPEGESRKAHSGHEFKWHSPLGECKPSKGLGEATLGVGRHPLNKAVIFI